jgi:hypothetical protein
MTQTFVVLRVQQLQHPHEFNAQWKFLAMKYLIIFVKRDNFALLMDKQAWRSLALFQLRQ